MTDTYRCPNTACKERISQSEYDNLTDDLLCTCGKHTLSEYTPMSAFEKAIDNITPGETEK
jgi:hypothetical protein